MIARNCSTWSVYSMARALNTLHVLKLNVAEPNGDSDKDSYSSSSSSGGFAFHAVQRKCTKNYFELHIPATEALQRLNKRNITTTHISPSLSLCLQANVHLLSVDRCCFSISCCFSLLTQCFSMQWKVSIIQLRHLFPHANTITQLLCVPSQSEAGLANSQLYICKFRVEEKNAIVFILFVLLFEFRTTQ